MIRLLLLMVLLSSVSAFADNQQLLGEANDYFRRAGEVVADSEESRGLYRQALLRFQKITDGGVENGKLYYNIGNAYFRLGQIGNAILNYKKALRYRSGDPNIQQNLVFARSKRRDRIGQSVEARAFQTVLFWHYDLSLQARLKIFLGFYLLFWVILISSKLTGKKLFPTSRYFAAGVALLLAFSVSYELLIGSGAKEGVVLAEEAVARKGDGRSYSPAFKEPLHAGTEFKVLEERGRWLQIRLTDSRECWVEVDKVGLV